MNRQILLINNYVVMPGTGKCMRAWLYQYVLRYSISSVSLSHNSPSFPSYLRLFPRGLCSVSVYCGLDRCDKYKLKQLKHRLTQRSTSLIGIRARRRLHCHLGGSFTSVRCHQRRHRKVRTVGSRCLRRRASALCPSCEIWKAEESHDVMLRQKEASFLHIFRDVAHEP